MQNVKLEGWKDWWATEIYGKFIQTDILAKAGQLKALDDVVKHAEVLETAATLSASTSKPFRGIGTKTVALQKS